MVKKLFYTIILAVVLSSCGEESTPQNSVWETFELHYDTPAEEWTEALPVGNGRLGAMVFGDIKEERIQLNEETLWTGGPYDPSRTGGAEALPEIQRLMFEGEFERAHDLFGRTMMGIPYEQMKYQPLGNLRLHFNNEGEAWDYRRELDLDSAISRVTYKVGDTKFYREVFSSYPDDVLVVRVYSSEPEAINFDMELQGVRNTSHSNYDNAYFQMDSLSANTLSLKGRNSDYLGVEGQLNYYAEVRATPVGGEVSVDYRTIKIRNADAVTLILGAATSFIDYQDVSGDPVTKVSVALKAASQKSYQQLLADHVLDHQILFRQSSLDIGDWRKADEPTDQRINEYVAGADPQLAALYYQYGRYLLIASSRKGTQAANLQGIWNQDSNPWWDSKYTVNINLPMNYWPAEVTNLEECFEPLYSLIKDVSESGRNVARKHYGAPGWVLHQNTDLWRASAPMDGPSWGAWPMGGAWLVTHLWEHFQYSSDTTFLNEYYPILRDQVLFQLDFLVEHPDTSWLVTNPSNSPENFPGWDGNGRFFDEVTGIYLKARTISIAPTMDMMILRELFTEFIKASEILDRDENLRQRTKEAMDRLVPLQEGKKGQLQEWIEDYPEIEPEHRHLSHLWGLFPGSEIVPGDPGGYDSAARKSIVNRGIGGCGWSMAHRMALWARLQDGDEALKEFEELILGSTNPNLICNCFRALQLDGTLGTTAAIAEMLMQSHGGLVRFLPAIPDSWRSGKAQGLRARGAFTIGIEWEDSLPLKVDILSRAGNQFAFTSSRDFRVYHEGEEVPVILLLDGNHVFNTEKGATYQIRFD